jgi:hypothetical protein
LHRDVGLSFIDTALEGRIAEMIGHDDVASRPLVVS